MKFLKFIYRTKGLKIENLDKKDNTFFDKYILSYNMISFVSVLELLVVIVFFVFCVLSLVYYASSFFEHRLSQLSKWILRFSYLVILSSFMLSFFGYPVLLSILSVVSTSLWVFIQKSGYPFVSLERPDFVIAIACTVLTTIFWMVHFLGSDHSFFFVSSCFFYFVWGIPFLLILSISTLSEDQVNSRNISARSINVWKRMFSGMFKPVVAVKTD